MAANTVIHVKNRAGARQAILTDYLSLAYTRAVNEPGTLEFTLPGDHAAISLLEKDGQIEVWRADPANAIDWYCDFYGLFRRRNLRHSGNFTKGLYTARCVGQLHFLKRSIVNYVAGTANRNQFTTVAAETILKNLVKYNATGSGTTGDGRQRNVAGWGAYITTATDAGGGSTLSFSCAWRNLLEALQDVSRAAGMDFDLVKTGSQAWEFRTYAGQLGTDRSATVTFSLSWDNMVNPSIIGGDIDEPTVAIVGGQGEGAAREISIRTGANHQATYDDHEVFVNASQQTSAAGREAAGDAALAAVQARDELRFDVGQVAHTLYGKHYFLGDLVNCRYGGVSETRKVAAVRVAVQAPMGSDRAERVEIGLVAV